MPVKKVTVPVPLPNEMKLRQRVEKIATTIYGADGVDGRRKLRRKPNF